MVQTRTHQYRKNLNSVSCILVLKDKSEDNMSLLGIVNPLKLSQGVTTVRVQLFP